MTLGNHARSSFGCKYFVIFLAFHNYKINLCFGLLIGQKKQWHLKMGPMETEFYLFIYLHFTFLSDS